MSAKYTEAAVQVSRQVSWFKLKERDWKIRSTKVDYGSESVNILLLPTPKPVQEEQ